MSRFGLRSASDVLKQSEERPNRRKTCNPVSISMKQNIQSKDTKYLTNINDENIIDDIKIEIEDVERVSDIVEGLPRSKSFNGGDDEDEEDGGECIQQPQPFMGGLICSLSLDRIGDVIERLNLTKSKFDATVYPKHFIDKVTGEVEESVENDDDDEDDNNMSKLSTSATKNLCLYCDKKFSSHRMQLKHVEKFHCLQQDRRCSGRKSQLQQTQRQRKRKTTNGSQIFPGCTFCQKNKCLSPSIILPSSDLSALFVHLADCHPDKYFGCKMCVLRFQNITNLCKHMEVIHKSLPFAIDESSCKSRDNDTDSLVSNEKSSVSDRSKFSLKRQQRSQKNLASGISNNSSTFGQNPPTTQCPSAVTPNTSIIGAEEPILSRLGLTQNRLPNNRKGVRLRREKLLPELLLKSEQNNQSSNNFVSTLPSSSSVPTICSPKLRGKAVKAVSTFSADTLPDVIFRVPTRNDFLSCVFDDNFYKEVVTNVRNNLLFHLDGKIMGNSSQSLNSAVLRHVPQPHIRSTLVKSPIVVTTLDSEIHAATSLAAVTAFPTLLTAAQFGGDGSSSKLRRPHTKNSWKWKWDNVKKFKLVNEGGKIVKKMKHPMLGLRDLSKLDMWTQLTMRKKRELQQQQQFRFNEEVSWPVPCSEISIDPSREEKQRLNDQLNMILDMRLLPHIILEQNEQAIIKLENDEFGIAPFQEVPEDSGDNLMAQTFADENFLSMLNLLPNMDYHSKRPKLVLSGEWARPRCYLCMCCGAKFEKQKSLEEHKMFRHSQILSTHYEVVGRELLNGNLLRHLFLPKKALSRYANEMGSHQLFSGAARRLFWHKNEALAREITNNDESSDSLQSMLNSCTTNSPSVKNSSSAEDCDIESKIANASALDVMPNNTVVSPTHSIQSCSSLSSAGPKSQTKIQNNAQPNITNSAIANGCSKCGRKCSGILDLYRHMLDCSGDYVWSLAKKRKYRYYCGSKKRRPCNKHSILELRKNKTKQPIKISPNTTENTEDGCASTSGSFPKTKTSPRPRPSDAESIKKMLENLPPKRVCKKIFPTLSKAKKNTKIIKPKLLAKHKIYNSLRKTRVRQMSQAAKRLSKTKSQLKKSLKMTTRSSVAPSSAAVTTKIINKKNKLKMLLNKNTKTKSVATKESPACGAIEQNDEYKDEAQSSIKVETEKEQDTLTLSDKDVKLCENMPGKKTDKNTHDVVGTSLQSSCTKDKPIDSALTVTVSHTFPISSVSQSNICSETSQKSTQQESELSGNLSLEVASQRSSNTLNTLLATCDSNQNLPGNKNIKRSKRISDCIAMLTGKLEQKLKTERKVSESISNAKYFAANSIAPQHNAHLPSATMAQIIPGPHLELSTPHSLEVVVNVDVDKPAASKKIPKRKTISRRIIKTDGEEVSGAPATALDSQMKVSHNVLPLATKPAEAVSLVKDGLLSKINIAQKIHTIGPVEKLKTTTEPIFVHVDGNQLKSFPPAALIPAVAGVMPLNSQSLISHVPLYLPVDNLPPPHVGKMPITLPLTLPVPAPPPIPIENITQSSPVEHTTSAAPAGINLVTPTAIPLMTTVPPAHLPPPSNIAMPHTSFSIPINAEPLNLSSSSKNVQKQSQDLSCSSRQRSSGLPARRQTICGFEARNFVMFDEMEPLDLSKKSRPENTSPAVHILPAPIEMSPLLLPVQNPASLALPANFPADTALIPVPPLTAEALLNKPFYSNLDLLRIPQVRNPVVGQVTTINESTPPPPPTPSPTAVTVNNSSMAVITTIKPSAKKRNKLHAVTVATASASSSVECIVNKTNNTSLKLNYSKESSTSKKDTTAKGKITLRMDEEVINHIDDAINSVINAVKASLDSEEAEKSLSLLPKTTDDVIVPKESLAEFKKITASRRNMRSKTLDCRPTSLNKSIVQNPQPINVANTLTSNATSTVNQVISVKNIDELKGLDSSSVPLQSIQTTAESSIGTHQTMQNQNEVKTRFEKLTQITTNEIHSAESLLKQDNIIDGGDTLNQNAAIKKCAIDVMNTVNAARRPNEIIRPPLEKSIENATAPVSVAVPDADAAIVNTTATNQTNLDVEQMSNNNNTSSGFHSSAQSDQQTSVMSTNTSVSVSASVVVCDTKKKQRRRRKNELAAIVADQLLESFKLDKTRRDNLKKLENLAYEKSEDLLLTGMLLMSSTKRNVNSASATNSSMTTTTAVDTAESVPNSKRTNKIQLQQNVESPKVPKDVIQTEDKVDNSTVLEIDKNPVESVEINDGKKSNKRKQYRRRGKTIDNENISKLKSSLESFSIDIERQLTEYEAKNVNVFKNASASDTEKVPASTTTPTSANLKPSVILRPSILSMTLDAGINVDNTQALKSSVANDTNKTVVSSRDPRLNKNIHKEEEKNGEFLPEGKTCVLQQKSQPGPAEIGDLEEDNYLTEIAKNVNEKIMSTENEEFAFKDDGFEMANEMGADDSNSKFSRPPTSMSVRSAPNFNDDRSNFGSICDENTNTEVMDMDLDDEMSVYTSYSQDLGRGRGRRRRRRRSILLTRKPKKRASSRDLSAEKIECILCKKVFYSANSLSKHNMTLAHVSKVSEQEYLLSKSIQNTISNIDQTQSFGTLGPYARRSARRATISEPPSQLQSCMDSSLPPIPTPVSNVTATCTQSQLPLTQTVSKQFICQETPSDKREENAQPEIIETPKSTNTPQLPKDVEDNDDDGINCSENNAAYNGNSRLNLNPDERLFFECCNILKSAETPRLNNVIVPEECNNLNTNYGAYSYSQQSIRDRPNVTNLNMDNTSVRNSSIDAVRQVATNNSTHHNQQPSMDQSILFRDPQYINISNCYNKSVQENRSARSPTYSAISHLSAVTNTTSRFKTKAAMKGYENVNVDLIQQQESKSRTICKLTELAEIALGNEDKPNSHSFSPIQSSSTPPRPLNQVAPCTSKVDVVDCAMHIKGAATPDFATLLAADNNKGANVQASGRNERTKNNETRSSTSSKTIMHSSIIKAAVEEHQKAPSSKIIIPERPFKNIGLEEKETITFQKPRTPAVHLLTEDNNSVSTGSFSDRDDYDFGSLSCDEEASVRESNDKNPKNNSTESSSESSRATAKTFENKSLIMGRIFKNVSTKAAAKNTVAVKKQVKSVGVQKDQTPTPKTDLNQLFDELRGNSGVDGNERTGNIGAIERISIPVGSNRPNHKQQREASKHVQTQVKHILTAASPPAIVSSTTATPSNSARKSKAREPRSKPKTVAKTRKDISKLQSELGMSPDEIKKLIDDGQRKSKRRCATNRPKKLVEMWSSDEYEEFLSTKDIIALIEEKEQEEKRKKRKNNVQITSNNSDMDKGKDTSDVTSSTKEPKRRNSRKVVTERQNSLHSDQINIDSKFIKPKKPVSSRKENAVSTTATPTETTKLLSQRSSAKMPKTENGNAAKTKSAAKVTKPKVKRAQKPKQAKAGKESKHAKRKKSRNDSEDGEDNENDVDDDDDDEDFLIADLKQKQINNTRSNKGIKSRAAVSAPSVTSSAKVKSAKSLPTATQTSRKRSSNNNTNVNVTNLSNVIDSSSGARAQKQSPLKGKRKNQTNQSPPRRKRPASEKLYYWSSSSDEDFGRINNNNKNKSNTATDNFDNAGEQYQKHGWIVGDSHKKLVTLLAIAKGNKKVDSKSGVKKNVPKKRN